MAPVEAASALRWLAAAGLDTPVDAAPRNWLAPAPAPLRASPHAAPPAVAEARPAPSSRANGTAGAAARTAMPDPAAADSIAALTAMLAGCDHPLCHSQPPQLLTGNLAAGLVILGDQPESGDTAVARLTQRMLAAIGLDADAVAFGHILPWPTPAGRPPQPDELAAFSPFLNRALSLARPRLILALGAAATSLAGGDRGINASRGRWTEIAGIQTMPTFHPRHLHDQPDLKRHAWADLQAFASRMTS